MNGLTASGIEAVHTHPAVGLQVLSAQRER